MIAKLIIGNSQFQWHTDIGDPITFRLQFIGTTFPNSTLDYDWYNGQHLVASINFFECKLTTITANAFHSNAFRNLIRLAFRDMDPLYIKFHSSTQLKSISFHNAPLQNVTGDLLKPFRRTLNAFNMRHQYVDSFGLRDLFAPGKWLSLWSIMIYGIETNGTRILHPSNFSDFPGIRILTLARFDIDYIHPETFDRIGETLNTLNLIMNKLKTLRTRWFAVYLDTWYNQKLFECYLNAIQCDCDFFETTNLTFYLLPDDEKHAYTTMLADCFGRKNLNCDYRLQRLSREKIFLFESFKTAFWYPRVELRMRSGNVFVAQTRYDAIFRLLIWNHVRVEIRKRTKCPSPEWIRDSIKCYRLLDEIKVVPVAWHLKRSTLTTFFAILVDPHRKVWPMHIQTVYRAVEVPVDTFEAEHYFMILIPSGCLFALSVGVFMVFCCRRIQAWWRGPLEMNVAQASKNKNRFVPLLSKSGFKIILLLMHIPRISL